MPSLLAYHSRKCIPNDREFQKYPQLFLFFLIESKFRQIFCRNRDYLMQNKNFNLIES